MGDAAMAAQHLVDSSAWTAYFQGQENPLLESALAAGSVVITAEVLAEILGQPMTEKQRQQLEAFFALLPILEADREKAAQAAKLRAELMQAGLQMGVRDAMLVQFALDSDATLLTSDPFFLEVQRFRKLRVQLH